ncbi:MAG: MBL fold metallo-hydrolase [Phycisphaera sp.]|nr:MBL fold metallo-hydrolase [Phycisphaera sp.]
MPQLHVESFALGQWMTNCYVLHVGARDSACWIVDAGFEPQPLVQYIQSRNLFPGAVMLTHAHLDHIAGLHTIRAHWPEVPIHIHPAERLFLTEPELNLSIMLEEPIVCPHADATLGHGQKIELDGFVFEVRHTPGHSPGGVTFYQSDSHLALVGDALFAGSVGRTDFPTSDPAQLGRSIREQLLTLPDATRVLPGHGPQTTIGRERQSNPWLR